MDAVGKGGSLIAYRSSAGRVPVTVTVLLVPTLASLNLPVRFKVMVSPFSRSPDCHVMSRTAPSVPSNTLSLAVTTGVTVFFPALNVQVAVTVS